MDIRDAHNRALTLRGALIHCDKHEKHAHRKTDRRGHTRRAETSLIYP